MADGVGQFAEIRPLDVAEALERGAFLLDVREPEEWEAGRAPGAHHIALGELQARWQEIPAGSMVICVCRSGSRSAAAAAALSTVGYESVNLVGGMQAWSQAGLSVESDGGGPGLVL